MLFRCLSPLAAGFMFVSLASAAPKSAGEPEATPTAEQTQSDSPTAQFSAQYREWKELIAKLTRIRERYQIDASADKKNLESQFTTSLAEAKEMAPKLTEKAETAYLSAPNENKEINDFLLLNLRGMIASDEYESAAKLAKILVDNNFDSKELAVWAGLAFYATNDFPNAHKYMKLALSQSGDSNADPMLETHRRTCQRYFPTIEKEAAQWAKEQQLRANEEKAHNLPRIKLDTSKGEIVLELFENEAPIATANFISLVEKKYYDGIKFHRILPGFMAQGGDPNGDGSGGPGYTIPDECYQENHRNHFRGSLSMAKTTEKDSGGSQFYITFLPTAHLDGKHTVFGRVVEGMDVLAKLQRIQPGEPGTADKIEKATVLNKRNHKYDPVKRPDKKK